MCLTNHICGQETLFTSVGGEGSESHEGANLDAVGQGRSELSPSVSLGVGVAQKSCL